MQGFLHTRFLHMPGQGTDGQQIFLRGVATHSRNGQGQEGVGRMRSLCLVAGLPNYLWWSLSDSDEEFLLMCLVDEENKLRPIMWIHSCQRREPGVLSQTKLSNCGNAFRHLKASEMVWLHMPRWDTERTMVNEWFEDPPDNVCVLSLFYPYPTLARAVASFWLHRKHTSEKFLSVSCPGMRSCTFKPKPSWAAPG